MSFLRSMFPASATPDRFLVFWKALRQALPHLPSDPPPSSTLPVLPVPLFEEPVYRSLVHLIGEERLSTHAEVLTTHACGSDYRGFLARHGGTSSPLAVVYPENETQITTLMLWAAGRELKLRPRGGGTATPTPSQDTPPYLVLNLTRLDRIQRMDAQSGVVTVPSGVRWDSLEEKLNAQGMTTGLRFPSPQSTVGGILATLRWMPYMVEGGLLARVVALRGITPSGPVVLTRPAPGETDMRPLLVGQRGRWGVITEASLRIMPLPEETLVAELDVTDWDTAIQVVRRLLQQEFTFTWLRLTPLVEWALWTPNVPSAWRLPFHALRDQGKADWVRISIGWSGRSESNALVRREIERLLKQEFPDVNSAFRSGDHSEALWPPRWLDESRLWEKGLLSIAEEALVPWNRAAPFLRDWERALQSIAQARFGTVWVTSSIYGLFEGAWIRTNIFAYPSALSPEEQIAHLEAITAVAQTVQERWHPPIISTKPLASVRALIADYFDPEAVWMR